MYKKDITLHKSRQHYANLGIRGNPLLSPLLARKYIRRIEDDGPLRNPHWTITSHDMHHLFYHISLHNITVLIAEQ